MLQSTRVQFAPPLACTKVTSIDTMVILTDLSNVLFLASSWRWCSSLVEHLHPLPDVLKSCIDIRTGSNLCRNCQWCRGRTFWSSWQAVKAFTDRLQCGLPLLQPCRLAWTILLCLWLDFLKLAFDIWLEWCRALWQPWLQLQLWIFCNNIVQFLDSLICCIFVSDLQENRI